MSDVDSFPRFEIRDDGRRLMLAWVNDAEDPGTVIGYHVSTDGSIPLDSPAFEIWQAGKAAGPFAEDRIFEREFLFLSREQAILAVKAAVSEIRCNTPHSLRAHLRILQDGYKLLMQQRAELTESYAALSRKLDEYVVTAQGLRNELATLRETVNQIQNEPPGFQHAEGSDT